MERTASSNEYKNSVVMDSSGKELKTIPSCYGIGLSKDRLMTRDLSNRWTITNFAGDHVFFGPAATFGRMVIREHFFMYFTTTSLVMKNWENKQLAYATLYAPTGTPDFNLVKRSNEVVTYLDLSGKRVILNYEGKELTPPLDDVEIALTSIPLP